MKAQIQTLSITNNNHEESYFTVNNLTFWEKTKATLSKINETMEVLGNAASGAIRN